MNVIVETYLKKLCRMYPASQGVIERCSWKKKAVLEI